MRPQKCSRVDFFGSVIFTVTDALLSNTVKRKRTNTLSHSRNKRVAIGAFKAECNPRSPISTRNEFEQHGLFFGLEVIEDLESAAPRSPIELVSFFRAFQLKYPGTEFVPLGCFNGKATGPIDQTLLEVVAEEFRSRLEAAGDLDAVFFSLHGSAKGVEEEDPEGLLLSDARKIIGPNIPILATLDLHANMSKAMVESASVLVTYRTNPHVDMKDRAEECVELASAIFGGAKPVTGFAKLPLIAPSPTHLTDKTPVADIMAYANDFRTHPVLNVSIQTGFTHGDSPKSGMSVLVTTDDDKALACTVAAKIARRLWDARDKFILSLITVEEAVMLAKAADAGRSPPVAFADTSDNPGGGGRGNTIWILKAFIENDVHGCVVGSLVDKELAADAHRIGEGESFLARFNRDGMDLLSGKLEVFAKVEQLGDGKFTSRGGVADGKQQSVGPMALLRIEGVQLVIMSKRVQTLDPAFFEAVGVDFDQVRILSIKSRGHFRVGFSDIFGDDNFFDVDAPGITARRLDAFPFKNIPRPMYPLDKNATWSEHDVI